MTWPTAEPIRTDRLVLEPLRVEHAAEMAAALASPELYEFTGGVAPSPAELRERYARQVVGHAADGSSGWLNWIVRDEDSGAALGYVQATLTRETDTLVAEVAWVVRPRSQRQGIATEAAQGMTTWLSAHGVDVLRACIHPGHNASSRVAERIGLRPTEAMIDGGRVWVSSDDRG